MEHNLEIITKVNELMHRGFEIPMDQLIPTAAIFGEPGLGLDSLDAVDMLVHLEESLGIKVEAEKLIAIRKLQDIYDLVESLAAPAQPMAMAESQLSH
jgi:acyl carrier protein